MKVRSITHRAVATELGERAAVVIHFVPADVTEADDGVLERLGQLVLRQTRQRRNHDELELEPADRLAPTDGGRAGKARRVGERVVVPFARQRQMKREQLAIAASGNVLKDDLNGRERAVWREVADELVLRRCFRSHRRSGRRRLGRPARATHEFPEARLLLARRRGRLSRSRWVERLEPGRNVIVFLHLDRKAEL